MKFDMKGGRDEDVTAVPGPAARSRERRYAAALHHRGDLLPT